MIQTNYTNFGPPLKKQFNSCPERPLLETIPHEILSLIFSFTNPFCISNIKKVSKKFYSFVNSLQHNYIINLIKTTNLEGTECSIKRLLFSPFELRQIHNMKNHLIIDEMDESEGYSTLKLIPKDSLNILNENNLISLFLPLPNQSLKICDNYFSFFQITSSTITNSIYYLENTFIITNNYELTFEQKITSVLNNKEFVLTFSENNDVTVFNRALQELHSFKLSDNWTLTAHHFIDNYVFFNFKAGTESKMMKFNLETFENEDWYKTSSHELFVEFCSNKIYLGAISSINNVFLWKHSDNNPYVTINLQFNLVKIALSDGLLWAAGGERIELWNIETKSYITRFDIPTGTKKKNKNIMLISPQPKAGYLRALTDKLEYLEWKLL